MLFRSGHSVSDDPTMGSLVHDLTQQLPQLIRSEIRLAQAEMTEKGKRAGIGVGMFGGAGVVGLYALGAVIAAAILLLATAITPWLAALIVAAVCGAIAGGLALAGKSKVSQATPPVPERATESVKEDVRWTKSKAEEARR